jgi:hypothetical protein
MRAVAVRAALCYHQRMRLALFAVLLCGCPHTDSYQRPYPPPSVKDVVDRLAKARDELTSFKTTTTDSKMDYRLGNQRANVNVLAMGTVGAKLHFAVLSPAGGSTIAEMACDGTNFALIDFQNNCVLSGPCDSTSIAQFIHLDLAPDDFLHLALGTVPVLATATGTVTWDSANGYEHVELTTAEGTQKIVIDARDHHWDVIESQLVGAGGVVKWSVENKNFSEVKGPAGTYRIPSKTWFKSPVEGNDVIVVWSQRDVNLTLEPKKFVLELPAGLPMCGQKPPGATPPATSAPMPPTGGSGSGASSTPK